MCRIFRSPSDWFLGQDWDESKTFHQNTFLEVSIYYNIIFTISMICCWITHCCVNQLYWLKKNPSLLSYKEIFFKTLKKNALVKEFSLAAKEKCFRLHNQFGIFFFQIFSWNFYISLVHSIQFFMLIPEIFEFKFLVY